MGDLEAERDHHDTGRGEKNDTTERKRERVGTHMMLRRKTRRGETTVCLMVTKREMAVARGEMIPVKVGDREGEVETRNQCLPHLRGERDDRELRETLGRESPVGDRALIPLTSPGAADIDHPPPPHHERETAGDE